MHRSLRLTPLVLLFGISACDTGVPVPTDVDVDPDFARVAATANIVDAANTVLEAEGSEYRVAYAEHITDPSSGRLGNVVFASDRGNKQLPDDFIPDDPRRPGADGDPNTIDVWIDYVEGGTSNGLSPATTTAAIARSVATWDGVTCSELNPNVVPVGVDLGLVQLIFGYGGGWVLTDVMHAGWLPGAFFDLLAPGGSGFILGVTFTLYFASGDLDGDGLPDLAAREIYYNDEFEWADDGTSNMDVESIALHEGGHGLSQGHFGKIFGTPKNGRIHFAPRAVMNAAYTGPQRSLTGTDNAGHCSLWANWPQN